MCFVIVVFQFFQLLWVDVFRLKSGIVSKAIIYYILAIYLIYPDFVVVNLLQPKRV